MAGTPSTMKHFSPDLSEGRHHLLRSPSTSSDITTRSTNVSVPAAQPAPAYVATAAACDLLVEELQQPVLVSSTALSLVNEFLDQVLYNILLASRSTSLSALKAAVPTVLKPRLGKAALRVAEEELKEYMNDDEESELQTWRNGAESRHDFDSDLAWRLARLRCMVYTRLGDLEEEDEEEWLENEGLRAQLQSIRRSTQSNVETGPASAILLTSIIEYLGEQALYYAAQHAQKRHHQHGNQQIREEETEFAGLCTDHDDLIISGKDMNHVGRDSPLSRLWRSYRRNTRDSMTRPMSPDFRNNRGLGVSHSRNTSTVPHEEAIIEEERSPDQIPLPIAGNDVDQIEVPGLAPGLSDDEEEEESSEAEIITKRRPASMIDFPGVFPEGLGSDELDTPEIPERSPLRPTWLRKRSISTPVTTMAKINASRRTSMIRVEPNVRDAGSQRPLLHKDYHSADSAEAVFGGAVASVAGALGYGALGVPDGVHHKLEPDAKGRPLLADEAAMSEVAHPKRTAAEEMLGSVPSVPPPVDAKTGASITNMKDFQNMYVPPATSSAMSEDLTPRAENLNPMIAAGSPIPTQENLRSMPLRTPSGKMTTIQPGIARIAQKAVTRPSFEARDDRSTIPDTSPPNTASMLDPRPQPGNYVDPQTTAPVTGHRETPIDLVPTKHAKTDSFNSANVSHSRNSSAGSRLLGITKDVLNRPQTVPQSRTINGGNEGTRRTNSPSALGVSRDVRPGTGNSSVSKRFHGKPLQLDDSDEAKKKSLEILIRGNETLHYTLTPAAAMRDEPPTTQTTRTPNQDIAEFLRNTGPRTDDSATRVRAAVAQSNIPEPPSSPLRLIQRIVSPSSPRGAAMPASPIRPANPIGEPRDPRAEPVTSTRDLADYARSTGPSDKKQLPLPLPADIGKPTSPVLATASVTTRTDGAGQDAKSPTSNRPVSRLKYQARDARTSRNDDTSDLIDFIREGPQYPGREHRIDRKVAPFRTTMDSEDFDNLGQGQGIASLRESEDGHHASSVEPSVTSQTPLIVTNARNSQKALSATPVEQSTAEDDGMPKRTRRRIKDPYAIYDSDDEDLENELGGGDKRNQEESLIDFLKNTQPPTGMKPQPILAARPASRATERLKTEGPRDPSPHLTQTGSKLDKYRPTQPTHATHIDRNRATLSSTTMSNDKRNSSKPRFEARDAKATRTTTSELAEYLKNSGPPPHAQHQPQPFILSISSSQQPKHQPASTLAPAPKDEKGLFKRFSRSKR